MIVSYKINTIYQTLFNLRPVEAEEIIKRTRTYMWVTEEKVWCNSCFKMKKCCYKRILLTRQTNKMKQKM